jgi:cell wall-associated NlpC family hydrolase
MTIKNAAVALALAFTGCSGVVGDVGIPSEQLTGANEDLGTIDSALSTQVGAGSVLATTAGLNLRSGPSTGYSVLHVIAAGAQVTAVSGTPSNGWYNIKHNGVTGWSSGTYLKFVSAGSGGGGTVPAPPPTSSSARDAAVARAKTGVGFSYFWGHGSWDPAGPTSSNRGVCTGSCPSCSHSGGYGADCSGYVGKIWQVPGAGTNLTVDAHPYSTASFIGSSSNWYTIAREALQAGDALVYNSNGSGHIFLYESGDGWGSLWAYEAKGCSYGIVHDLRTASSAYKAIVRSGY